MVSLDRIRQLEAEIGDADVDLLQNTPVDNLAKLFAKKFQMAVPELDVDHQSVHRHEKQIDVSQDPRSVVLMGSPPYVTGIEVKVEIPFTGDREMFGIQLIMPSHPYADVRDSSLILSFDGLDLNEDDIRRKINDNVALIQHHLESLRSDASGLNNKLPGKARSAIEERRRELGIS